MAINNIKVLHLNDRFVTGGVSTIINLLSLRLSFKGLESSIIINDKENSVISTENLRIIGFGLRNSSKLLTILASFFPISLLKLIISTRKSGKNVVLHLHCPYPTIAISSIIASILTKTPLIYSIHANRSHLPHIYWHIEKFILTISEKVIFELKSSHKDYPKIKQSNKFISIPFGVEKNSANVKWIKPNTTPFTFVIANRLDKNRMTDVLIKAYAEYSKKKNSNLIIIGNGSELNNLVSLVSELGIDSSVSFLESQKECDLQLLFLDCHCLLTISASGDVGMTGKIAAGIGMPLLTYEFDSTTQYPYQSDSINGLAQKMLWLESLNHHALLEFIKSTSKELMRFSDDMLESHLKLYQNLI